MKRCPLHALIEVVEEGREKEMGNPGNWKNQS